MQHRRLITCALAAVAVAGALVAPSVLAAPYAGQYIGLVGSVSVTGSDGATYRLDLEVTQASAINVGTSRELRLDVTRCVGTRCVGIGHHLKGLLAEELTIAPDYHSGSVRTAFAGQPLIATWSYSPPTGVVPIPDVGGTQLDPLVPNGLPHPGARSELYRFSSELQMSVRYAGLTCPGLDPYGYERTGADTVGRDLRETRTPEPLRLPAGLSRVGSRSPRCTPVAAAPAPAPSASPSASPSPSAGASVKPTAPLPIKREIVEIRRTRKSGIAVLALAGRITAHDKPGFFAAMDVYRDGGDIRSIPTPDLVDFGLTQEPIRYGHGGSTPLCTLPLVCILDKAGGEMSFTLTVTDDTRTNDAWQGRTHYLLLEGTGFELESAAVGFSVKRRKGGFDRRTAIDSDADGVATLGLHAEVFRAASILGGGPRGSIVVAQLPCEAGGTGAASLTHDSDQNLLSVASPMSCEVAAAGMRINPDAHIEARSRTKPGVWRLEGAVTGLTSTQTRLLVMHL